MIYSSRSRIETFQECQRRGYINYLWDGRGLQKRAASVYLSTGTYTHIGLEFLFKRAKDKYNFVSENYFIVDEAVRISLKAYQDEIKERGFDLEEGEDSKNQSFIVNEQCALVEAFIRSFAIRILPDILNRFRIIDVEREEFIQEGDLIFDGRLDVILEEISTSDIYIVSFKTAASWDRRQEKANEHDNQGLSETFLLENRLRQENLGIYSLIATLENEYAKWEDNKLVLATSKYKDYLKKFLKREKVMGVIMIYLLKGKRYESYSKPGLWEQHSPLIRGYYKLIGTTYEYAGSLYYDNPSNKSGKGRLGKGWESFNVWESEEVGFIKGWIHMLVNNEVGGQDIIGENYKIPAPYFRNQGHLDSWFRQAISIESNINSNLVQLKQMPFCQNLANSNQQKEDWDNLQVKLDYMFPQTRKHCHYPSDCQFLDICYNQSVFDDPIGSGKFIYRKAHHIREIEEHEKLYQISNQANKITGQKEEKGTQVVKGVSKEVGEVVDINEIEEVVING